MQTQNTPSIPKRAENDAHGPDASPAERDYSRPVLMRLGKVETVTGFSF